VIATPDEQPLATEGGIGQPLSLLLKLNPLITEVRNGSLGHSRDKLIELSSIMALRHFDLATHSPHGLHHVARALRYRQHTRRGR
jgi:hypothetical protein